MANNVRIFSNLFKIRHFSSARRNLTLGKVIYDKPKKTGAPSLKVPEREVPGLSSAVFKVPNEPVGPGASKNSDYKNPEYFCYDNVSYFEAEVEMLKYRCPQPSTTRPYHPPK